MIPHSNLIRSISIIKEQLREVGQLAQGHSAVHSLAKPALAPSEPITGTSPGVDAS